MALRAGRPLVRVTDTWDAIEARAKELADAYLDLTVRTKGPDTTLADRARELFPYLVKVRALRPPSEAGSRIAKEGRAWRDLYADFYRREFDDDPPAELLTLFDEVLEEAADTTG